MTHKRLLLLLLICFCFGVLLIIFSKNKLKNDLSKEEFIPSHPLFFFDKDSFYTSVGQVKNENNSFVSHVSGGIIPHHLFPGFIIAEFFARLSAQSPKTIILVGPNHYERGDSKVLSSIYNWETPFGLVEPNEEVIQELLKSKLIRIDEEVLSKEHSVAGIMPFIKYYLPQTKVVPVVISGFMVEKDIQLLSKNLKNCLDGETVIIAAVDFSHYLVSQQAQEKDNLTLALIKNFDYHQLFSLTNEYLDSPPSIALLLMTMRTLGSSKMEILHHTNSGEIQKNNSIETTSYFSIAYY